jgi:MFS transporter, CP family, cyanate transporter
VSAPTGSAEAPEAGAREGLRVHAVALTALFLAALSLRPQIVGVGPLIPSIQHGLHTSHAIAGLLGTIPVLCMGMFAPLAAYLAARVGTRRAMTLALVLIGVLGIARALSPNIWTLVLLTIPVGIGMGVGNAIAPIAVRDRIPRRPALGTGSYTTGIQVGSSAAALSAVPLAGLLFGWRGALTAFSAVTCVLGIAWYLLTRDEPAHARVSGRLRLPFRSPTAWLLIFSFGLMGSVYYGLNAWLPDAYAERGWSDTSTGVLVAMMNISAVPCSFLIPWLSERYGGRVRWLSIMSLVFLTGCIGLVEAPSGAYGWSLLAGTAQGGMFALTMTLPLDLEHDRARLGSLIAMMLGGGYTLAAIAPFALGAVRDTTGSFDAVLRCVVGFNVLLFLVIRAIARVTRQRATAAGP